MIKNKYFILTGAMGAGKTTILNSLREKGFVCIDEAARQIINEQRSFNGEGVWDKNPHLFVQLMLSRAIYQYEINSNSKDVIIFDRGIPDLIGHAELSKMNKEVFVNASKLYKYNENVFMFNGWKEIYSTDEERKMDYDSANRFGKNVSCIYKELGYNITDVPFDSVEKRVEYIISSIESILFL
jgi:predicted ATPase